MPATEGANGNPSLNITDHEQEKIRHLADFPKNIWGDLFTEFTFDEQVYHILLMDIEALKKEVRSLFLATGDDDNVREKLKLINTVQQLGISYHYKEEIEEQLKQIFNSNINSKNYPLYDLNMAALQFRLLREHGFIISCDIFDNFLDANGKLKESLISDTKGLVSLYEAAQLRTKEDIILEDALACATANLKQAALPLSSSLGKQVKRALEQSLWKGHQRTEARYYISAYEEDNSKNETLLKLAKLDYKLLQMLYRKELCELMRWWRELNLVSKLGYARDRMVECYYWALGNFYEPEYSRCRIVLSKTIMLTSIIDDTYDAYGTLDELQLFTDALERWDRKEIDGLPDYLKACYMALLDLSHEIEEELSGQEKSYAVHHYNEMWKEYARYSNIQAKWFYQKNLPTFDEYMNIGLFTSSYNLLVAGSLILMKSATREVFDWLASSPKIMVAIMAIGRLLNDVASHKFEKERDPATALHCYMNHYNVSEEEAMMKLEEITEDTWKDFNEEWIKPIIVPREILARIQGFGQLSDVCYKHDVDGFTEPVKLLKPHIIAMLVDPIII